MQLSASRWPRLALPWLLALTFGCSDAAGADEGGDSDSDGTTAVSVTGSTSGSTSTTSGGPGTSSITSGGSSSGTPTSAGSTSTGSTATTSEPGTTIDTDSTSGSTTGTTADTSTSSGASETAGGTATTGEPPAVGVPFGFWGANGYHSVDGFTDLQARFGIDVVQVAAGSPQYTVNTFLPMARAAGIKLTLRLTGNHPLYTTGVDFDLAKWKAELDAWDAVDLAPFIADGTLIGHMVLDDIANWNFDNGGRNPTGDELDEMARYSKLKFPGLLTYVRQRATEMPRPTAGTYQHLDACVNQYRILEGDVQSYATEQAAAAASLDLGIIHGLNLADGGDGSSGQPGWRGTGFWAMSAAEIAAYGDVLLRAEGVGMFLCWEYDAEEQWPDGTIGADYFDDPARTQALLQLAQLAATRPAVELRRP